MSVIEAMACGCLPVCSRSGALPEVAGDAARYMETYSGEAGRDVIRQVLSLPDDHREAARQRVVDHFSVPRRRQRLLHVVREVLRA